MQTKRPKTPIHGFINLNKPLGITSSDAVNKAKWLIKPTKIGHAGTLDPLATGVLPLALGEGTKCINLLMDAKKTYEFAVTFGERRTTDDAEGEVVATSDKIPIEAEIRAILPRFTGVISQLPPIYSALKVDGKRAYDLARAGEEVALQPRNVTIHALEFSGITTENLSSLRTQGSPYKEIPALASPLSATLRVAGMTKVGHFRATVSKGTYIRSLGRDIAQALGSEGYISRLHRAAVGPFTDAEAISLDFLEKSVHNAPPPAGTPHWLTPLERALDDIPAVSIDGGQLTCLRHGQRFMLAKPQPDAPLVAVLHEGKLVALAQVAGNQVIPVRVLVF
jgi:tRNA pseudouridine55 synthase